MNQAPISALLIFISIYDLRLISILFRRALRLILMRIRFRASDFGQVRKKNIVRAKIETGFLCEIGYGDGARVIYLFALLIQQLAY